MVSARASRSVGVPDAATRDNAGSGRHQHPHRQIKRTRRRDAGDAISEVQGATDSLSVSRRSAVESLASPEYLYDLSIVEESVATVASDLRRLGSRSFRCARSAATCGYPAARRRCALSRDADLRRQPEQSLEVYRRPKDAD